MSVFSLAMIKPLGGDEILNGAGLAEQNMIYAYLRLDDTVSLCQKTECLKDPESQQFLQFVSLELTTNRPKMVFSDVASNELILTDAKISADLQVINQNLYPGGQPIQVVQATRALVLALCQHHSQVSPRTCGVVAEELSFLISKRVKILDQRALGQEEIRFLIFDVSPLPTSLVLSDSIGPVDITQNIKDELICPMGTGVEPNFTLPDSGWLAPAPWNKNENVQTLIFSAQISYSCASLHKSKHSTSPFSAIVTVLSDFLPTINGAPFLDPRWPTVPNVRLVFKNRKPHVNIRVIVSQVQPGRDF